MRCAYSAGKQELLRSRGCIKMCFGGAADAVCLSGERLCVLLGMYAGLGATLGHNFPFYLKFKGGKGIAVLAGLIVSTSFWMVPIPLATFAVAVLLTRYVSLGSLLASTVRLFGNDSVRKTGGFHLAWNYRPELYGITFLLMLLAWIRHKDNIKRLLAGQENRFGTKK